MIGPAQQTQGMEGVAASGEPSLVIFGDVDLVATEDRTDPPDHTRNVLVIEMPRMDGYELVKHLKSDSLLRYIPFILLSSRDGLDDVFVGGAANQSGKLYLQNKIFLNI